MYLGPHSGKIDRGASLKNGLFHRGILAGIFFSKGSVGQGVDRSYLFSSHVIIGLGRPVAAQRIVMEAPSVTRRFFPIFILTTASGSDTSMMSSLFSSSYIRGSSDSKWFRKVLRILYFIFLCFLCFINFFFVYTRLLHQRGIINFRADLFILIWFLMIL